MRKDDISRLLARYLSMQEEGKDTYFDADEIEDLLDSFEDSEDYTLYEGVLSLGMKLHPNHPGLQIKQCKLMVYNEQFTEALAYADSIGETNEPELDLLRIECYCSLDQYATAKDYTEKLIMDECEYLIDVFEYIAPILGEMGMHKEAIEFINRGRGLFPDSIELKEELCYNLESVGRISEAIVLCNELLDDNPYSFEDWASLGRLYSLVSDFDKAIEAFDFALTCDDSDNDIKILKAFCLFMNENYQKAIEVYYELIDTKDYKYRVKPLLAECYMKLDDYETAYSYLHEALSEKMEYEEPSSYINYLLCCAKTDRLSEEPKILNDALQLFPNHINLLYLKALYCTDVGEEEEAIRILRFILSKMDPSEEYITGLVDTYFQLANLFLKKNDFKEALEYFQKVLALSSDYPMVHLRISICYINMGDSTNFIKHISKCTEEEITAFEGDYVPSDLEKEKVPLIELIRSYLNSKNKKK